VLDIETEEDLRRKKQNRKESSHFKEKETIKK